MGIKIKKLYKFVLVIAFISLFINYHSSKAYAGTEKVYLGGFALGFDLSSEGALVVGLSEVICDNGICLPAREAGIKSGDCILSLNGIKINCANDIDAVLGNCDGNFIVVEVLSNGEKCIKNVFPQKDISGTYKLGVLVRDYISGLGTVTFIRQDGTFCSLGHPIIDEAGNMLKISGGYAYECAINDVVKGERGRAGELKGHIYRSKILGEVVKNSQVGLAGVLQNKALYESREQLEIGDAKPGFAQICSTIEGEKSQNYDISIIKVDIGDKSNKNLVIKIEDQELISKAGGIVQGMSGSPIIQDGKIVGAVTHVFLNDSTRGYGICISKMMQN